MNEELIHIINPVDNTKLSYEVLTLICEAPSTMPEKLENGGFTLKMHEMFSVYTKPEEFCLHKHHMIIVTLLFPKFLPYEKESLVCTRPH